MLGNFSATVRKPDQTLVNAARRGKQGGVGAHRAGDYHSTVPSAVSTDNVVERQLGAADHSLEWLTPGIRADMSDGERFTHSPANLRLADSLNRMDHLPRRCIGWKRLGRLPCEAVAVRRSSRNVSCGLQGQANSWREVRVRVLASRRHRVARVPKPRSLVSLRYYFLGMARRSVGWEN